MEMGDLAHIGMQYAVMMLMLYSASPQGRRLFEQLLVGDPYDIDIKLDNNSRNRSAEIVNVLLKAMGLRLVFQKIPKKKEYMALAVAATLVPNKGYKYKTNIPELMGQGYLDDIQRRYIAAKNDKKSPYMAYEIMAKKVDNSSGLRVMATKVKKDDVK